MIGGHFNPHNIDSRMNAADADVAQIFLSSPRSWYAPITNATSPTKPFYVHAPYIINISSSSDIILSSSISCLTRHRRISEERGAKGMIVHAGSWRGHSPRKAGQQWRRIAEDDLPLLIEGQAGGRYSMARSIAEWKNLWNEAKHIANIGACLDTAHLWAAVAANEDPIEYAREMLDIVGAVDVVHANGAKYGKGSGIDAHSPLPASTMPLDIIREIIELVQPVAVICESSEPAHDIAILKGKVSDSSWADNSATQLE